MGIEIYGVSQPSTSVAAGATGGPLNLASGSTTLPAYSFSADARDGMWRDTGVGGIAINHITPVVLMSATELTVQSGTFIAWNTDGNIIGSHDPNVRLYSDGAGVLALKNGANAQAFRVYGTTTGPKYVSLSHNGTDGLLDVAASSGQLTLGGTNATGVRVGASGKNVGFYGTTPIALQTGVAVSAAGIHAALVALGLITA